MAFSASKSTALSVAQRRSSHTLTEDDGVAADGTDTVDAAVLVQTVAELEESPMATSEGPPAGAPLLEEDIEDVG